MNLNQFAQSKYIRLPNQGLGTISKQLDRVFGGGCSAGFAETLSRIYTALTLIHAIIIQNKLEEEESNSPFAQIFMRFHPFFSEPSL